MALIYETRDFIVEAFDRPHVTRTDGGHIKILPKERVPDRTEMPPEIGNRIHEIDDGRREGAEDGNGG
ncbi:MAG: hypothetical protein JXC85_01240 [Candidatus Aenigmarchaeota archaeon]|nr:hypothetical protein [Candidatus Aenigmarchaeota archaeon]